MKTYITEPTAVSQPLKFPLLARHANREFVVLFSDDREGTVVVSGNRYRVGYYFSGWITVFNEKEWQILPPGTKVTLEQEAVS